jgi:hypothetical protein
MIRINGNELHAETSTLTATFRDGLLTSLRSKLRGEEVLRDGEPAGSALQLLYANQATVDVVGRLASNVTLHRLSDRAAQFRFSGWDADGVLTISEAAMGGDLLIEPSAYSSRPGVLACRWRLAGIPDALDLVAPFFQGVRLKLDDPLLHRRWFWPQFWEAGLAILQGRSGGFWVHCRDDRYRYKALQVSPGELGLETEAYGPLDGSLGAGGLTWRLNVYEGDWKVPASVYRSWLHAAYGLDTVASIRKPWIHDVRLALSWYGGDSAVLDALAARIDPSKVLLHYSDWRSDGYDENYPTYQPSDRARALFAKAKEMGFHLMPHCNSVDMDPTNPAYNAVRDFQYRDVQTKALLGWGWDTETNQALGVPNSYESLSRNRARKVMIKVHPGHSMWRSLLTEQVRAAARTLDTDVVFLDVTLCSHNLHNCLVENTTSSEGMKRLIQQIAETDGGLAVGGEGLNEITMQGLSFAQAHLFTSWQQSCPGLERTGGCALNDFLFGSVCRTFGYSGLSGKSEAEELRMRLHAEHGAIPTIIVRSAEDITSPNRAIRRELDRATS